MINLSDMLSQAEIDALLNGTSTASIDTDDTYDQFNAINDSELNGQEIDALGEIGNISMGTSATTLSTLLGNKVTITTPKVTATTWDELSKQYLTPFVAVNVEYTYGLVGSNLMIINENDVKIITDLMMGGDGTNIFGELTELHLSAISEAMNQMVGSSSTSMSAMFSKRIDISPPRAFVIQFNSGDPYDAFKGAGTIVKIAFRMVIGDLIDSEIMQLLPISFAKELVNNLFSIDADEKIDVDLPKSQPKPASVQPQAQAQTHMNAIPQQRSQAYEDNYTNHAAPRNEADTRHRQPVNVQPVHFQSFEDEKIMLEKKNISLIMDVPLEVTVELGRTHKLIKDILEFGAGSIIELDKLAGEPVDILVNGKPIAKGEVVVIDESFGVRITDIIHPSKRL